MDGEDYPREQVSSMTHFAFRLNPASGHMLGNLTWSGQSHIVYFIFQMLWVRQITADAEHVVFRQKKHYKSQECVAVRCKRTKQKRTLDFDAQNSNRN